MLFIYAGKDIYEVLYAYTLYVIWIIKTKLMTMMPNWI